MFTLLNASYFILLGIVGITFVTAHLAEEGAKLPPDG